MIAPTQFSPNPEPSSGNNPGIVPPWLRNDASILPIGDISRPVTPNAAVSTGFEPTALPNPGDDDWYILPIGR